MDQIKQFIADSRSLNDPETESEKFPCEEELAHRHRWSHIRSEADLIRVFLGMVQLVEDHPE
ncbi:Replication protein A 70 kDa DNA-binding subunit [Anopheles sinensis]|uniref:Replication protein A 70 kDa DNA-binding subunit n=1 Tax=Anopheles sinensis TaxID=74873 RepID=A0A084VA01_ANOSI|nr:Replication protein A 70 kDa DNA-binding subunit [Anopheles sinensis]